MFSCSCNICRLLLKILPRVMELKQFGYQPSESVWLAPHTISINPHWNFWQVRIIWYSHSLNGNKSEKAWEVIVVTNHHKDTGLKSQSSIWLTCDYFNIVLSVQSILIIWSRPTPPSVLQSKWNNSVFQKHTIVVWLLFLQRCAGSYNLKFSNVMLIGATISA